MYYLLGINTVTFVLFGIDKLKSQKGWWRIPEKTLLMLAVIGGSMGALCGMRLFHHKTKHKKFYLGVPILLAIQIALICYSYRIALYVHSTAIHFAAIGVSDS